MEGYFRFVTEQTGEDGSPINVSQSDEMWIVRKAAEIYRRTGCTWLGARMEAETQFIQEKLSTQPASAATC